MKTAPMKTAKIRFGVFAQLALLMGGLAAVTTALALIIQDRTLSADLREAASNRLARSAEAAERLLEDHLQSVVQRYAAISTTPEFRANLEAGDRATLAYHAESLTERTGAAAIAFESPDRSLVAAAGDASLQPLVSGAPGASTATYVAADGRLYAAAGLPLRVGDELVGHLVAAEPVDSSVLDAWSSVLGVQVGVGAAEPAPAGTLAARVQVPGATLQVSTTYEAERLAISRARQNLVLAGMAAMGLAVLASALLAHSFARPIRKMKLAAERVGGETVDDAQFDVHRPDELGDLGRAFNDMLSRLRESEIRLARAQRLARFSNWWFDPVTDAIEAGPDFRRLFELEDSTQIRVGDLIRCVHPDDRDKLTAAVERVRAPRGAFRADVRVPVSKGRDRVLHLRAQHRGAEGQPARVEASAQDVTERWNSARQIEFLSLHDSVTGLGNRRYLFERLSLQLKEAERNQSMVVLLLIGIDGFASIEGAMGHQVGDELLCEVARRLVATLAVPRQPDRRKKRDSSSYSVVRFGNDEFAAVDTVLNRDEAATLAETVAHALEEPYVIEGHDITVSVSIGISVYPEDATTVDALVRYGKTALQTGRSISDAYHFYDESMHQREVRRLRVAALLRRAIEREELEVHYQPRVRPDSGRIVAVEALARWTHDELGPISPSEFVPIAEDVGLIQSLGDWCLRAAVRDLLAWRALGLRDIRVSVNLSPQEILPGLVERVLDITHALEPRSIEFEVTESAVLRDPDEALVLLNQLSEHGFKIALDDFGTGYSSLSHVRQLPLDAVKVDRSFIQDLGTNQESLSITGAVIMMCQAMDLESVAEGVETEQQRRRLVELGCDEAQGHLFAAPMPPADLMALLERQRAPSIRPARRRRVKAKR